LSKYVFDLEKSAKGLRLNRFLNGLVHEKNRKRFLEQPEEAMQGLSEAEKDMVRRLDWKGLQDYGASFFLFGEARSREGRVESADGGRVSRRIAGTVPENTTRPGRAMRC
jgi:hypothetical protein